MPRLAFSPRVTGSMWAGFMHVRFRHRWSIVRSSAIGPLVRANAMRAGDASLDPAPPRRMAVP